MDERLAFFRRMFADQLPEIERVFRIILEFSEGHRWKTALSVRNSSKLKVSS